LLQLIAYRICVGGTEKQISQFTECTMQKTSQALKREEEWEGKEKRKKVCRG
jgi:hypothetical protein